VSARGRLALVSAAVALAAAPPAFAVRPGENTPVRLPLPTVAQQTDELARLATLRHPIGCSGGNERVVALTFDDGPGIYTRRIIRVLRRFHARATFFVVGNRLQYWPSLPRQEAHVGVVENHTWSHPLLPALPPFLQWLELSLTQRALTASTQRAPQLFRPPYEARSPETDRIARSLGLLDVLWTVDAGDSVPGASVGKVERTAIAGLRPGAIVLMHDLHRVTLAALPEVLRAAQRRHLQVVTVPELFALDPPAPDHHCPIGAD
jgi:peptidoglycan-N-acetylglucosamine deacetylase